MKEGWEVKRLGEVLVKTSTVDPTKSPEQEFIYIDVSSVNKDSKRIEDAAKLLGKDAPSRARKLVETNDVIFATVRPTHSRVTLITDEYDGQVCSTGYFVLRGKEFVLNKYIFYFLLTEEFNELMGTLQKGASYPAVTDAEVKSINLRYPKSLSEQERIVAILDEAFAALAKAKANAEQNLMNAKELFESYLQGVFEDKGEGWEEKTLGEFAVFRNGMNFTKSSKGEEIKIVGVRDFQKNFWVPFTKLETVVIDGRLNEIDLLKKGDIIAVRSNGNPELIGRTLLSGNVEGKVSHSGFSIRIRLNSNIMSALYLCTYLKTQKTRKKLVESGNGVGIKSLNQGSLSNLSIPFPKSLDEQQSIVQKLDALSVETKRLEAIYEKKIEDLAELKKTILQKAFNGELGHETTEIIPRQGISGQTEIAF